MTDMSGLLGTRTSHCRVQQNTRERFRHRLDGRFGVGAGRGQVYEAVLPRPPIAPFLENREGKNELSSPSLTPS